MCMLTGGSIDIPILIPCDTDTLSYNERNQIVENARALCRKLADRFDMDFRVGFGSVKPLDRMSESYEEERIKAKRNWV